MAKLNQQSSVSHDHSEIINMLICCSRNISYYVENVVLLIFEETVIQFPQESLMNKKLTF